MPEREWLVEQATVLWNRPVAEQTWRLGMAAPQVASRIRPGQFVMLRLGQETADPLLARPYALYDVIEEAQEPVGLEIIYLVVGRQTGLLTRLRPGAQLVLWGPLGNGFDTVPWSRNLLLVAGGIGQTPFYALAAERLGVRHYGRSGARAGAPAPQVTLCYGVRSSDRLACVDDFYGLGLEVHLCTEDGSAGRAGLVTDVVAELLGARPRADWLVVGCGPEPMLHALQRLCLDLGVRGYLSLETPMACGVGVCFSCAVRIRTTRGTDYRRCCVEGPVFEAETVVFDKEFAPVTPSSGG